RGEQPHIRRRPFGRARSERLGYRSIAGASLVRRTAPASAAASADTDRVSDWMARALRRPPAFHLVPRAAATARAAAAPWRVGGECDRRRSDRGWYERRR